jgi:predicted nuclease of predicted toxin-antitoxin system
MSQQSPLLFISLYTDEDVTIELAPALRRRGYIAQSAQEASNREISDEAQLEYASTQGMAILTYNSQDFIPLAERWFFAGHEHAGIIVSQQFSEQQFGELLRQALRLLDN